MVLYQTLAAAVLLENRAECRSRIPSALSTAQPPPGWQLGFDALLPGRAVPFVMLRRTVALTRRACSQTVNAYLAAFWQASRITQLPQRQRQIYRTSFRPAAAPAHFKKLGHNPPRVSRQPDRSGIASVLALAGSLQIARAGLLFPSR